MVKKPKITIIGSINQDFTTTSKNFPEVGETIIGDTFCAFPGGKGANQAIAAAKLGGEVNLIGKVGNDSFGKEALDNLDRNKVHTEGIVQTNNSTGIANVLLHDKDNRIIIIPNANEEVTPSFIDGFKDVIFESDIVVTQFEIPVNTVSYAINLCFENKVPIIVNPAPFEKLPLNDLKKVTYLTPNEKEYNSFLINYEKEELKGLENKFIITKGARGIKYYDDRKQTVDAHQVSILDTTGAGDTFNGALAFAFTTGLHKSNSIRFANAAGALSTTKVGAQSSMPMKNEVEQLLES